MKFALEVHPTEIAFDIYSRTTALEVLDRRPEFGFNFDPSHLIWQGVDPVGVHSRVPRPHLPRPHEGLGRHAERPHRHPVEPSALRRSASRLGLPLASAAAACDFEEIIRALNAAGYPQDMPLSVEWEDSGMDREAGAAEACQFCKNVDFAPSGRAFDAAFAD